MDVTVYTKPNCPQCEQTKMSFDILGISYQTVDVTVDTAAQERLIQAGHRALPVVAAGDLVWSGHSQDKISALYNDLLNA